MNNTRTFKKYRELEEQYDLLSEKIARFRRGVAIEAGIAAKFQLEKELEQAEQERNTLEQRLQELDTDLKREASPKTPVTRLRSEPQEVLGNENKKVFRLANDGRPLEYLKNDFQTQDGVVIDHATGLMWQRSGSDNLLSYNQTKKYVKDLNVQQFAGYHDWRLPTIPELMSLLEPAKQSNSLYINPIFDEKQQWCWSADKVAGWEGAAWLTRFSYCDVYWHNLDDSYSVRCVRSVQD